MTSTPLQIHPWTVLGVDRDASPEEIRSAFREKSKKYHPDHGGDEWVFRMVQHAYDTLRIGFDPSEIPAEPEPWNRDETWREARPWGRQPSESAASDRPAAPDPSEKSEIESSWLTQVWPNAVRWFHPGRKRRSEESGDPTRPGRRTKIDPGGESPRRRGPSPEALLSLHTVEVELVWIRFAADEDSPESPGNEDESTLSVCMVVSWPPVSAVDAVAGDPEATATLRSIIGAFEGLKHGAGPTASRSKIEDGRFVGWLSYGGVVRAESAFKRFREAISAPGLSIRLRTRHERLPFQWRRGTKGRAVEGRNGESRTIFSS